MIDFSAKRRCNLISDGILGSRNALSLAFRKAFVIFQMYMEIRPEMKSTVALLSVSQSDSLKVSSRGNSPLIQVSSREVEERKKDFLYRNAAFFRWKARLFAGKRTPRRIRI